MSAASPNRNDAYEMADFGTKGPKLEMPCWPNAGSVSNRRCRRGNKAFRTRPNSARFPH